MGFLSDVIVPYLPRVMVMVSAILNTFAFWLIIHRSPTNMKKYRDILIFATLTSLLFDVTLSLFLGPLPVTNASAVQMNGLMAHILPEQGDLLTVILIYAVIFQCLAIMFCFVCRESSMRYPGLTIRRSKWVRIFQVVSIIIGLIVVFPLILRCFAPEEEVKFFLRQQNITISPGMAVFVVIPSTRRSSQAMCAFVGLFLILMFIYTGISLRRVRKMILAGRGQVSASTSRLQAMLTRALVWQSCIPIALLIMPITIVIVIAVFKPLFPAYTDFLHELTAFALSTPCLYSPAHVISMIYFTTPYRRFCVAVLKVFRQFPALLKKHHNNISSIS